VACPATWRRGDRSVGTDRVRGLEPDPARIHFWDARTGLKLEVRARRCLMAKKVYTANRKKEEVRLAFRAIAKKRNIARR
jgi:hypothetical protein